MMMKKDIEWLKKEIGTEMIELESHRAERWSDVKYQTLRSVVQKLDQLDEPEITLNRAFEKVSEIYPMTKEEVCRHLEKVIAYGGRVTYGEPEVLSQELPVIPKYVADWIETHLEQGFDLYPALKKLEDNSRLWTKGYNWYRENTLDFTIAYLTKEYKLKEEPLYYALIKGHELVTDEGEWTTKYWNLWVSGGSVFPADRLAGYDDFLTTMSKEEWSEWGINDTNADFVKVEEIE